MDLVVEHRLHGDLVIVTVVGEIDVSASGRLREHLIEVIKAGRLHLVLDLTGVTFLDSTGLGVLVGCYHRLRAHDGSMVLVGASERVADVFRITRLDKVFPLHATLDQALAADANH